MIPLQPLVLGLTTTYQIVASWAEDRSAPPGQFVDVGGHQLTDGLYESGMLHMPLQLQALKFFFMSGFLRNKRSQIST